MCGTHVQYIQISAPSIQLSHSPCHSRFIIRCNFSQRCALSRASTTSVIQIPAPSIQLSHSPCHSRFILRCNQYFSQCCAACALLIDQALTASAPRPNNNSFHSVNDVRYTCTVHSNFNKFQRPVSNSHSPRHSRFIIRCNFSQRCALSSMDNICAVRPGQTTTLAPYPF
jgi:hypothetical protein